MLEWMMVLGYRQNCQNWIKTFISFFCSVCFVVYVHVINVHSSTCIDHCIINIIQDSKHAWNRAMYQ